MLDALIVLCLFIILMSGIAILLYAKRVPGAVARSGAITNVIHKRNAPTDLFLKRQAEKRVKYLTYKYSKRHKKKLGRSNGIQTVPTESSGDDPEPNPSLLKGARL